MRFFLYKNNIIVSTLIGILCVIPLFFVNFPTMLSQLFFSLIIFLTNSILVFNLILMETEKKIQTVASFVSKKMELDSLILVKNENNLILANFTMKSNSFLISFSVEVNREVGAYNQLNLDSIMIKKGKEYLITIKKETSLLDKKEIYSLYSPISIDYWDLEPKLYSYKIKNL